MRDDMAVGDGVLFYHSSCAVPGVAGVAEVVSAAYADETQFDRASPYYDAKASREQPRWISLDIRAVKPGVYLPLAELRAMPELEDMVLLKKGSRLSVSPVGAPEWKAIVKRIGGVAKASAKNHA